MRWVTQKIFGRIWPLREWLLRAATSSWTLARPSSDRVSLHQFTAMLFGSLCLNSNANLPVHWDLCFFSPSNRTLIAVCVEKKMGSCISSVTCICITRWTAVPHSQRVSYRHTKWFILNQYLSLGDASIKHPQNTRLLFRLTDASGTDW